MTLNRRTLLTAAAAAPLAGHAARAQTATVKIGVLNDQSGVYRDISGPTSVACVKQAVEEFASKGFAVEVLSGDHQNKPDVGTTIARQWIDRDGVDMIIDVANSGVALAINAVCRDKDRAYINSTGAAMVKSGGDSWFFITADYAFGTALERDTTNFVKQAGGRVLGSVRHPFPGNTDFSSFLLQAQASKAKVVGICNAGTDTVNTIKQAAEFGLTRSGVKLAGLLVFINDVHALGLEAAQGLVLTESFYWDLNDRTRAFTKRVLPKTGGAHPAMSHAGCYAGALHYLKAVADMGVAEAKKSGAATVTRMKAMPTDDDCFGAGTIRADGRKVHPVYLFEVKKPSESKAPWDYYKLIATTPADQAFRPLNEGGCALVHA